MSGHMFYPYRECKECQLFDWDKSDTIVNKLLERCEGIGTEKCSGKHTYDCFDYDGSCDCEEVGE